MADQAALSAADRRQRLGDLFGIPVKPGPVIQLVAFSAYDAENKTPILRNRGPSGLPMTDPIHPGLYIRHNIYPAKDGGQGRSQTAGRRPPGLVESGIREVSQESRRFSRIAVLHSRWDSISLTA